MNSDAEYSTFRIKLTDIKRCITDYETFQFQVSKMLGLPHYNSSEVDPTIPSNAFSKDEIVNFRNDPNSQILLENFTARDPKRSRILCTHKLVCI